MLRTVVLEFLGCFAVTTAEAAATLRITNGNDPAAIKCPSNRSAGGACSAGA